MLKADFHLSFRLPPRQDFRVEESSTLSAKPFSAAGDCATLRHQRKSCRGGRRKLKWKSAFKAVSYSLPGIYNIEGVGCQMCLEIK